MFVAISIVFRGHVVFGVMIESKVVVRTLV